jgi:hypothetical protein
MRRESRPQEPKPVRAHAGTYRTGGLDRAEAYFGDVIDRKTWRHPITASPNSSLELTTAKERQQLSRRDGKGVIDLCDSSSLSRKRQSGLRLGWSGTEGIGAQRRLGDDGVSR